MQPRFGWPPGHDAAVHNGAESVKETEPEITSHEQSWPGRFERSDVRFTRVRFQARGVLTFGWSNGVIEKAQKPAEGTSRNSLRISPNLL